jgi:hypothetical protein
MVALTFKGPGIAPEDAFTVTSPALSVVPDAVFNDAPIVLVGIVNATAVFVDNAPVAVSTLKVNTESVGAPDPVT